jgi:hypothetical protein
LIHLGKGYLATNDEKYVHSYKNLLKHFRKENPFCSGVNWVDTGEVSIRLLNIIFSIPFIIHSEKFNEEFLDDLRKDILLHSIFIENNFNNEDYGYGYFATLASLAAAGLVLRDSYYGEKILRFSYSASEEAIRKLITSEGISTVRSVQYHPHITELFIILRHCFEKASINLSGIFLERYRRMFDALASFIREDNSVAAIGDPFITRIIPFSDNLNTFSLVIGAVEFEKGQYKNLVPEPVSDLLFLKGKKGVMSFYELPEVKYSKISYGYPESGFFVLRNNDIHITVDASDTGSGRKRTVGHNDILSFELFSKGEKIIVDPGSYTFFTDPEQRQRSRSVKNHNTIFIDDEEPVGLTDTFGIREDLTSPKVTEWHSDEYKDVLSVQHYAYARFADPVIIKRIFTFQKERNKVIIRDELFGGSTHHAVSNLIFAPGIELYQTDEDRFKFSSSIEGEIIISTSSGKLFCTIQDTEYSPEYGIKTYTKKITLSLTAQFPLYIVTEIIIK